MELAIEEDDTRDKLKALEAKYASVKKVRQPAANIGCWWTLYDHGLEAVKAWPTDDKRLFPGEIPSNSCVYMVAYVSVLAGE